MFFTVVWTLPILQCKVYTVIMLVDTLICVVLLGETFSHMQCLVYFSVKSVFEKVADKLHLSYHWWYQQWTALFIQWRVSTFFWRLFKAFDGTPSVRPPPFPKLLSPWTKPPRPRKWQLFIEILQNLSLRRIFYSSPEMSTRAFDPGKVNQATTDSLDLSYSTFHKKSITCWGWTIDIYGKPRKLMACQKGNDQSIIILNLINPDRQSILQDGGYFGNSKFAC